MSGFNEFVIALALAVPLSRSRERVPRGSEGREGLLLKPGALCQRTLSPRYAGLSPASGREEQHGALAIGAHA